MAPMLHMYRFCFMITDFHHFMWDEYMILFYIVYMTFIMHENRFLFHFCHYLTLPNVKNLILEIKGLNENNIYELFLMEYEFFWKIFEFVKEIRLTNQTEANTN